MRKLTLTTLRFALLSAALACSVPASAADAVEAHWTEVCSVAGGNVVHISTSDGAMLEGYCVAVGVDEISIRTKDRGVVKVARSALSRISMALQASDRGHELRALRRDMKSALKAEIGWVFSPHALGGLVSLPATLAWGAVATPFCAIADLEDKITGDSRKEREIKVI